MPPFKSVLDIQIALQKNELHRSEFVAFCNDGNLFFHDEDGTEFFSAYYGSVQACQDVCALLGVKVEEV